MGISQTSGADLFELDARQVPTVMESAPQTTPRGLLPLSTDEAPTVLDQRRSPGPGQQGVEDLPYLVFPIGADVDAPAPFAQPAASASPAGLFVPELGGLDADVPRATPWRLIALALALVVVGLTITVILIVALQARP